jgi:signal transduction histidine kinase
LLLVAVRFDAEGRASLAPRFIPPIYSRPYSGHYYVVRANGGRLESRSFWDRRFEILPPSDLGAEAWRMRGPGGEPLLVRQQRFEKQGHIVEITVAEDLSELEARIDRFEAWFALGTVLALAILILSQRLILRRSLAPLQRLGAACRQLETGEIDALPEDGPLETRPLVGEINRLLIAQRDRLQRSRRSLGNLAHALKTPLTLARHLVDREDIGEQTRRDLERSVREMSDIVDRELRRARLAGDAGPGQRVKLLDELRDLTGLLRQLHPERSIQVALDVPAEGLARVDREDLLELLGNLLENAFGWASGQVRISATTTHGLDLRVEDDGPGVPPEQLRTLTSRGLRLDESRPGHGLGLSIVEDIVTHYGGQLDFGRSTALGGLEVRVRLPG